MVWSSSAGLLESVWVADAVLALVRLSLLFSVVSCSLVLKDNLLSSGACSEYINDLLHPPLHKPRLPYRNSFTSLIWYLPQRARRRMYKDRTSDEALISWNVVSTRSTQPTRTGAPQFRYLLFVSEFPILHQYKNMSHVSNQIKPHPFSRKSLYVPSLEYSQKRSFNSPSHLTYILYRLRVLSPTVPAISYPWSPTSRRHPTRPPCITDGAVNIETEARKPSQGPGRALPFKRFGFIHRYVVCSQPSTRRAKLG